MCIHIYFFSCGSSPFCAFAQKCVKPRCYNEKKALASFYPFGAVSYIWPFQESRTKIPMAFPTSPGFGSGPAYENRWKSAMAFSETVPLEHTIKPKKNLGTPRKIQCFSGTEDHGKPSLFHADFLGVYPCLSQLWMWKLETPMENGWPWLTLINQGSDQWITGLSVAEHGGWAPIELPLHHGINWGHHVRQTHMKVR